MVSWWPRAAVTLSMTCTHRRVWRSRTVVIACINRILVGISSIYFVIVVGSGAVRREQLDESVLEINFVFDQLKRTIFTAK